MVRISVDISEAKQLLALAGQDARGATSVVMDWFRERTRRWLEALLKAELTIVLDRQPYERRGGRRTNYRNGYRERTVSLGPWGPMKVRVPRDRKGKYRSKFLPFRNRRSVELASLAAEMFLGGLSTRDVCRVFERHFKERLDSKEVSRMVEATCMELDSWLHRDLSRVGYRFLFADGANFRVRRNKQVEKLPFLAVVGIRSDDEKMEVLAITVGDRERKDLWLELFHDLQRRGLRVEDVELGVMDGLPGLEEVFRSVFFKAQTQRCQVHAKGNAVRRVSKKDREEFRRNLNRVLYARSDKSARAAFDELKAKWQRPYPTAIATIERDLDSLLRFLEFDEKYWCTIRTTNPIERVNKEFKRRTKAMEITGGELTTFRLMAYVALTMNFSWRKYCVASPKHFYTLKAA